MHAVTSVPSPLDDAFAAAAACCRTALAEDYGGVVQDLADAPRSPEEWFDLLAGVPEDGDAVARLLRLKQQGLGAGVERLAVLNALLAAGPRMRHLAAHPSVKQQFCELCAAVASPPPAWEKDFDLAGAPFAEMAQIATLRRLPAGQLVFDFASVPKSWLLKIHPLDLPAAIIEIAGGLGGFGPLVSPHLNHWRANPLLLLQREYLRSLWRISLTLELRPEVKGLMADAWFYAAEVGTLFPHLAWVRRFFLDQGAFLVELEPASAESGFLVGSARRRRLHQEGNFQPRRTLVLWRRADMLAWAAEYDENAAQDPAPRPRHQPAVRPAHAAGRLRKAGLALLNRRPKLYAAATLLVPALALAVTVATIAAPLWAGPLAFALAIPVLWLLQYFYFQ